MPSDQLMVFANPSHSRLQVPSVNDIIFFLKDKECVKEIMNVFDTFSVYSYLKPSKYKCKPSGRGSLGKGASRTLWDRMYWFDKAFSKNVSY